ncbi:MAG: threonine ammonia-lyase IlvA [Prevotellaceae bacterium]|jgi:threonine dehydratase|nr:threonine ammonia-lyase IlvA [Prevotellaceae bacterium]
MYLPQLSDIQKARQNIATVVAHTPLTKNLALSEQFSANVMLKREDLQMVRSYKIRGAYNKISSLTKAQLANGVVCASAGNHAQGVAYSCHALGIKGTIFMPTPTPNQKVKQVKMFGKDSVQIISAGDTFDDAYNEAKKYCDEHKSTFIHPFDDEKVIEGQATVGLDILNDTDQPIDYLFVPIGGGGLAAGLGSLFKNLSPEAKIIGVEPSGAACMKAAIDGDKIVTLNEINTFADGVAVRRAGNLTFEICKRVLDDIVVVPEGKICTTILQLYNESAIVVEPAGAISISALDFYKKEVRGKNVVCVVSGSNNDITRMEEIKERSLLYEGLKHYFIIRFPQRAGALREFLEHVLGPNDDITHFEYKKKHFKEKGPAVIGIEVHQKEDFKDLIARMKERNIVYEYLNGQQDLFQFLT